MAFQAGIARNELSREVAGNTEIAFDLSEDKII